MDKALFFVRKTWENNWGRDVLLNWLDTDLYERDGKAITNFQATLPAVQSDLAQQITKDPYQLDFLNLREEPTLKSKACLKCLYFMIIIFNLCCYLEYFSYLYTINQTE